MGMRLSRELEAKCEALALPRGNPRLKVAPDARWAGVPAEPVTFTVAVMAETPNPLNGSHGSWRGRAAQAREQLRATLDALNYARLAGRVGPAEFMRLAAGCTVTLRRVCPGKGLADDALPAALKHIRDGVAQWLLGGRPGERDDDPRLRWVYEQSSLGKSKGVIVTLTGRESDQCRTPTRPH